MGQIADDMINGLCCGICGQYFLDNSTGELYEHGHPVACNECYDNGCGYVKQDGKATIDFEPLPVKNRFLD